ncbi:zinc finger protein 236-like [Littorina saxatilis]|uniref:zinc finger protein 236-like n=1 Tax=Littorina saxatilis TaxID=31220 RepID=UPI0038B62401
MEEPDGAVYTEVKVEIDIAEEPVPLYLTDLCTGVTKDVRADRAAPAWTQHTAEGDAVANGHSDIVVKTEAGEDQPGLLHDFSHDTTWTGKCLPAPNSEGKEGWGTWKPGESEHNEYPSASELSVEDLRTSDKNPERPHACPLCPATYKRPGHLREHMLKHTGEKDYACEKCDETFGLPQHLKQHMLTHSGQRPHKCPHCDATFMQQSNLKRHKRKGHPTLYGYSSAAEWNVAVADSVRTIDRTLEKPYTCHLCTAAYKTSHNLKEHMFKHTGEKSHACAKCDEKFSLPQHLKKHMLTHSGERPHKCPHCDATFMQQSNLKRHKQKGHPTLYGYSSAAEWNVAVADSVRTIDRTLEKPHTCHLCPAAYKQANHLMEHMFKHTGEKAHACAKCDEKFSLPQHLKKHMLTHSGQRPHKCPHCDATFMQQSNLKRHKQKGHPTLYAYSSAAEWNVAVADSVRTIDRTLEKPHTCHLCDAAYKTSHNLKEHMFKHTGEKAHACAKCDETFSLPQHLKQHMLTHSGQRPHKCPHCDATFRQPRHLKRHKRKGHPTLCGYSSAAEWNVAVADSVRTIDRTLEKPHTCHLCAAAYKQPNHLMEHMFKHTGEKAHACAKCDEAFSLPQHLKRHMLSHTGQRPYKCQHCDASFLRSYFLTRHIQVGHPRLSNQPSATESSVGVDPKASSFKPDSPASDATCQDEVSSTECIRTVSVKLEPAINTCDEDSESECPVFFSFPKAAKSQGMDYTLQVTKQKPSVSQLQQPVFAQWGSSNSESPNLEGKKQHSCSECDEAFTTLGLLEEHMLKHDGETPHTSAQCDPASPQNSDVKTPTSTHTVNRLHSCKVCEAEFSFPSELKRHMLTHAGQNPCKCTHCDAPFMHIDLLTQHIQNKLCVYQPAEDLSENATTIDRTLTKPHICQLCDTGFKQRNHLRDHMLTHTEEKAYGCARCDATFRLPLHLKRHMLTHMGERPHKCPHCDAAFILTGQLTRHIRNGHPEKKPYQCPKCDAAFIQPGHLVRHKRKEHSKLRGHFSVAELSAATDLGHPSVAELSAATDLGHPSVANLSVDVESRVSSVNSKPNTEVTCQNEVSSSGCVVTVKTEPAISASVEDCKSEFPVFVSSPEPALSQGMDYTSQVTEQKPSVSQLQQPVFAQWGSSNSESSNLEGKKQHSCSECDEAFATWSLLKEHMLTHDGEAPHTSAQCDPASPQTSGVKTPTSRHAGNRPHSCEVGDAEFSHSSGLKPYMLTHTGQQPCKCTNCDATFLHLDLLIQHVRNKLCGVPSATEFSVTVTENATTIDRSLTKPHICQLCRTGFKQRNHLRDHMLTHTGEKAYGCANCDARFHVPQNLKRHVMTHTGQKPHKCPHCDAAFILPGQLPRHIQKGHPGKKPYQCPQCNAAFILSDRLAQHKRNEHSKGHGHLSAPGKKLFTCHLCPSAYKQSHHLREHMFKHTGEKSHACAKCDEAFSLPQHLKRHMLSHTGARPYKCQHCDASFIRPYFLTRHLRVGHPKLRDQPSATESSVDVDPRASNANSKPHSPAIEVSTCQNEVSSTESNWTVCVKLKPAINACNEDCESECRHLHVGHPKLGEQPSAGESSVGFELGASSINHKLDSPATEVNACQNEASSTECNLTVNVKSEPAIYACDEHWDLQCRHLHGGHIKLSDQPSVAESSAGVESRVSSVNSKPDSPASEVNTCQTEVGSSGCVVTVKREPGMTVSDEDCKSDCPVFFSSTEGMEHTSQVTEQIPSVSQLQQPVFAQWGSSNSESSNLEGKKQHSCSECDDAFTTFSLLEEHMLTHDGEAPHTSAQCDPASSQTSDVKTPTSTHAGNRLHSCKVCDSEFSLPSELKRHMLTHAMQQPCKCTHCDVIFMHLDLLTQHIQNKLCVYLSAAEFCENATTVDRTLTRPYICQLCDTAFKQRNHLRDHMLTHTEEKAYGCAKCDATFRLPLQLKRHLLTHIGIRPHKCPYCDAAFILPGLMTRHMRNGHPGIKLHQCPHCDATFMQPDFFTQHLRQKLCRKPFTQCGSTSRESSNPEGKKHHCCSECDEAFSTLSFLEEHMLTHAGETPHTSAQCDPALPQTSGVKTPTSTHDGNRPHSCKVCAAKFRLPSTLKRHMFRHKGEKNHACPVCCARFVEKCSVKRHMLSHRRKTPDSHSCAVCDATFCKACHLKVHMLKHTGHKNFTCTVCKAVFQQLDSLKAHMLNHAQRGPLVCPLCNATFKRAKRLEHHISTHGQDRTYKCSTCIATFASFRELKNHRLQHVIKRHTCPMCPAAFRQPGHLKEHMVKHTGEKHYSCEKCDETFSLRQALKKHMLNHAEQKPHKCPHCDAAFLKPGNLTRHIQRGHYKLHYHSSAAEFMLAVAENTRVLDTTLAKPYTCHLCPAAYKRPAHLKEHMVKHTGERAYACGKCDETFCLPQHLKGHMVIHSGQRRHKCPHCDATFMRQLNLKRHIHKGHTSVCKQAQR